MAVIKLRLGEREVEIYTKHTLGIDLFTWLKYAAAKIILLYFENGQRPRIGDVISTLQTVCKMLDGRGFQYTNKQIRCAVYELLREVGAIEKRLGKLPLTLCIQVSRERLIEYVRRVEAKRTSTSSKNMTCGL